MLQRLRTIFSKTKLGSGNAPPQTVDETFLRNLAEQDIYVIAATQSEGIDANTLTPENLLAEIRAALERDRGNQKTGYSLFIDEQAGQRRLPFFSSNEYAQIFCGEYSKERNRVFPFMVLQTKGALLARAFSSSCDLIVMNDKSQDERTLTPNEIAAAPAIVGIKDSGSGRSASSYNDVSCRHLFAGIQHTRMACTATKT